MQHHVVTVRRIACPPEHVLPRQDDGPSVPRLALNRHAFIDHLPRSLLSGRMAVGARVDEHALDAFKVIRKFDAQNQKARHCGDGHAHLVGDLQTAAPDPVLLSHKDLDEIPQLRTLGFAEVRVVGEIAFEVLRPLRRERHAEQLPSASVSQPREHERWARFEGTGVVDCQPRSIRGGSESIVYRVPSLAGT